MQQQFPANLIKNQKYNIITFLPILLYNQFKFFLNLFFLIMACSQFIPQLRIGYLYTYWFPLGFVLSVTIIREAIDDIRRWQRDRQVNSEQYSKLTDRGRVLVASSQLKVGDVMRLARVCGRQLTWSCSGQLSPPELASSALTSWTGRLTGS